MDDFYKRLDSVQPDVVPLVKKLADYVPLKPLFISPKSDYFALIAQFSDGQDILLSVIYHKVTILFGYFIKNYNKFP